jgi:restriction system protein
MTASRKRLTDDFTLWAFQQFPGHWTISGTKGIERLARLELQPSESSRGLAVSASLEFGKMEYLNDDVMIHIALRSAHLSVVSEQFQTTLGSVLTRTKRPVRIEQVDGSSMLISRSIGNERALDGAALEDDTIAFMEYPSSGATPAEITAILTARPSSFQIYYEYLHRSTDVDFDLTKRSVINHVIRRRLPTDPVGNIILAKLSFASQTTKAVASNFLLKSVVISGNRTSEGTLIKAVALPWFDIIALIQKDPSAAYEIPPEKWEEIVAGAYKKAGFDEVILTPRSGDFGRDVIAVKKGLGIVRVIDQVKAYKPSLLVDAEAVRALMGVLQGDGASKGYVTTTSSFAPGIFKDPLIKPFMPSRLELIDGKTLFSRLGELARRDV